MSEPKPFASLGPTLLARKGGARPAMRPQYHSFPGFERSSATHAEDLGWNDMGDETADENGHARESGDVLALTPMSGPDDGKGIAAAAPKPAVRLQQEEIARQLETASPAPAARMRSTIKRRSALDDGRRAAFTLRVDAERHLKLRLACTIRNKSAQQLVTEALDLLLDNMTDLETLAAQVKRQ